MANKGTIVEVKTYETVDYCLFFFFPIYFCKRLTAFSCKYTFSQRAEIYSSKFNLLSVIIPNSFTGFDVFIVMFSVLNVILVLLF